MLGWCIKAILGLTAFAVATFLINPTADLVSSAQASRVVDASEIDVSFAPDLDTANYKRLVVVPEKSEVSYAVGETFFRDNRFNVAIGRTQAIKGELYVDPEDPLHMRIPTLRIDISTLRSDSSRRDDAIRDRWLESARYPMVTFTPKVLRTLSSTDRRIDGRLPVEIAGELTIREVTQPVTFKGTLVQSPAGVDADLEAAIRMTDFGFDPPSIFGMLRADNEVKLTVSIVAGSP